MTEKELDRVIKITEEKIKHLQKYVKDLKKFKTAIMELSKKEI